MKPIITKFNDKTGDVEITIPVPFTLKDRIEYVDMVVADIPKYEDTKDYNVFELIRENQELKKQLEESINSYTEENALRHKMSLELNTIKTQQKEFIELLEEKILRSSYIGEDGFGRIQYESKDIYYEINKILLKYKEIVGGNNDQ